MQANRPHTIKHATPTATPEPTTNTHAPVLRALPPLPELDPGGQFGSPRGTSASVFSDGIFVKCGRHQYGVDVDAGAGIVAAAGGRCELLCADSPAFQSGVRCPFLLLPPKRREPAAALLKLPVPPLAEPRVPAALAPLTTPLPTKTSRLYGGRAAGAEDAIGEEESLMVLFKTSEGGLIVVKMMDGFEPGRRATAGCDEESPFAKPIDAAEPNGGE